MSKHRMVCTECKRWFTCSWHCEANWKDGGCLCYECDVKKGVAKEWLKKCSKHYTTEEIVVFT